MKLKQLLAEERAVSPVIGVILMVAITVILAAVIGTFVLGLGENVQSTPQAKFAFDYQNSNVTVTHEGGAAISPQELSVTASSDFGFEDASGALTSRENASVSFADMGIDGDVSAGTSVKIGNTSSGNFNTDTVRVVWSDTDTDKSATLGRWDGPSA